MNKDCNRARHACFTINNYPDNILETLSKYQECPANKCNYIVAGLEVGELGTPHVQGYIQWSAQTGFARLAKLWKAAFFVTRGTSVQARDYCFKEGKFFEYGVFRNAEGNRSKAGSDETARWDAARESAKAGDMDAIPSDIYIRYCKSLEYIRSQNEARPATLEGNLTNLWIHGVPGTGKSRVARMCCHDVYYPKNRNKWWDNYKGEEVVIMDEVGPKDADWLGDFLKIWGDRYCFNAETKGSSKYIRPKHLIITSNYSMDEVFKPDVDDQLNAAIKRRYESFEMLPVTRDRPAWPVAQLEKECVTIRKWLGIEEKVTGPEVVTAKVVNNQIDAPEACASPDVDDELEDYLANLSD